DVNFDQLAYMSCSGTDPGTLDKSTYFTFRLSAYQTTGLALTSIFRSQTSALTPSDRSKVLEVGKANMETQLQLAVQVEVIYKTLPLRAPELMKAPITQT